MSEYCKGCKERQDRIDELEARFSDSLNSLVLQFHVDHPGEMDAGIWYYSDDVEIRVASGDAGGEDGEFAEHIRHALAEWFDGAGVELQNAQGHSERAE